MNWVDSHCHLADPRYDAQLEAVLARSREAGVTRWIQGGIDPEDWDKQRKLKKSHGDGIILSFGLHPWKTALMTNLELKQALGQLERALPETPLVGEIGLDFGPKHQGHRPAQEQAFRDQLELACSAGKPVALHIVHAHEEALSILAPFRARLRGGWAHLFTGSYELACRYIDLGFMVSIGGPAARPKGFETLKRALPKIPGEWLVLETDSPDQSPDPSASGTLNEPARLIEIAQAVAALRSQGGSKHQENWKELLDRSTRNVERVIS